MFTCFFPLCLFCFPPCGRPIPAALPLCAHLQRNGLQSYSFPATNQNFSRTFVSKNRFLSAIPPEFGSRRPVSAPFEPSMRGFARARCGVGLGLGFGPGCGLLLLLCLGLLRSGFGQRTQLPSARAAGWPCCRPCFCPCQTAAMRGKKTRTERQKRRKSADSAPKCKKSALPGLRLTLYYYICHVICTPFSARYGKN
jgi:hypothetical protein